MTYKEGLAHYLAQRRASEMLVSFPLNWGHNEESQLMESLSWEALPTKVRLDPPLMGTQSLTPIAHGTIIAGRYFSVFPSPPPNLTSFLDPHGRIWFCFSSR